MASSGPNNPGTLANVAVTGDPVWISPSNAATSNDSWTAALPGPGASKTSDQLKATNFGFSIPAGATIDGVVVEIERSQSISGSGTVKDHTVQLCKAGTATGANKADTATTWPGSDAYKTYGGSSDLWSATLTDSDVNNSGFGVILRTSHTQAAKSAANALVDHIRITVHYTEGGVASVAMRTTRRAVLGVGA